MNKNEFFKLLSQKSNTPKSHCEKLFKCAYHIICDNLKKNEEVVFKGIGKFFVKKKSERLIYGGFSKEKKLIPNRNVPAFKVGREFKDIIK